MRAEHALVSGGSVAGLLAAGALAAHFERVTVLERDQLPDSASPRKGVPQGNQIHILLPIGEALIDQVFPGLHDELVAAGGNEYNQAADVPLLTAAGWRYRGELEMAQMIGFRRPLLELLIRRRLQAVENVEIRQASVVGLQVDEAGADVVAVRLKDGELLACDFLVDAGGRGSKAPKWLRELGFEAPEEDEVRVYMGYATQFVEIPDGVLAAGAKGVGAAPRPDNPVGGVIMPADNGVHALSAIGMMKNYPPADREGMIEFLEGAPTPLLAEIARGSKPVSEVHTYRQPGNLRRRWENLERRPGRFAVIGDAVASFNPVYGQGLTMAALGATCLQRVLADPAVGIDDVGSSFQESLREGLDVAFAMAAGGDALFAGAELRNFAPPSAEQVAYLERLEQLATVDPEVLSALLEATFYMRPQALEREAIRAKATAAGGPEEPRQTDPGAFPGTVQRAASSSS